MCQDQLTLFQPEGTDYAQLISTGTPGFSDLPTALLHIVFPLSRGKEIIQGATGAACAPKPDKTPPPLRSILQNPGKTMVLLPMVPQEIKMLVLVA